MSTSLMTLTKVSGGGEMFLSLNGYLPVMSTKEKQIVNWSAGNL